MIPLLLASLLAVQDPAAPNEKWKELDGVIFIINEDIVTLSGFQRRMRAFLRDNAGADPNRARDTLKNDIIRNAVGSQAGEAMGIDINLIKRSVHDYERRLIDSKGGVDQYAAFLSQNNESAEEMRSEIEKYVLRDIWEASCTGKGPNQQQKITVDRFVRPGTLRLKYGEISRDPRAVARIGGSPSKVVLKILEIDPAKVGGTANLETRATQIRARIASGASDFDKEMSFALSTSKSADTEPLDEGGLPGTDPDLARLVASAKEGELLPPLPPHGTTLYWRIVKLVRRVPAEIPGFKATGVQKTIHVLLQDWLDNQHLDRARLLQYESSYIWPSAPAESH